MLLVLLNAHHEPLPFTLPAHKRSVRWQMILDTAATKQGKKQSTLCGVEPRTTSTRELVYHRNYATRDEATLDIFEYIEVFYNRRRRHSTLGYYSPAEFDARTAVA
jgi:transposase InsO family protein